MKIEINEAAVTDITLAISRSVLKILHERIAIIEETTLLADIRASDRDLREKVLFYLRNTKWKVIQEVDGERVVVPSDYLRRNLLVTAPALRQVRNALVEQGFIWIYHPKPLTLAHNRPRKQPARGNAR